MAQLTRGQVQKRLCDAVAGGGPARFSPAEGAIIAADLLRRLVLSLPVAGHRKPYPVTPIGIRLAGATIEGRLDLDNAVMADGGPLAALELSDCFFDGGFSGAHGHFSRLCFSGSSFRGRALDDNGRPLPTIDLTNARIDSDLSMRAIAPRRKNGLLWIRARGVRVEGAIDLSCSTLKGPREPKGRRMSDLGVGALNLSLAEIKGDLQFVGNASSLGTISARRAIIRGDVWMSGAHIEATVTSGGGREQPALFFQSAEIGGLLVLDGRADDDAGTGDRRPFRAYGMLNLADLQLGGSLLLSFVQVHPPRRPTPRPRRGTAQTAANATPGGDAVGDDPRFVCLSLEQARIGDSVYIEIAATERSRLHGALWMANLEVKNSLHIKDCFLGVADADRDRAVAIDLTHLTARELLLANIEPLLWEDAKAGHPGLKTLSIILEDATLDSLEIRDSWLNGWLYAPSLRCSRDVRLDARVDRGVELEGAELGGSLDISELRLDRHARGLSLREAAITHSLKLTHTGLATREGATRLVKARQATLACLPRPGQPRPMELIECLWRQEAGAARPPFFQTAFILSGDTVFPLDGKQTSFDSLVGHFGHNIVDSLRAAEFVRLHCAFVHVNGTSRHIIASPAEAPPCLAIQPAKGGPAPSVAGLDAELFRIEAVPGPAGEYRVSGCTLHGPKLVQSSFRLSTRSNPVQVKAVVEKELYPIEGAPLFHGQFVCHPARFNAGDRELWIAPAAIDGMQAVEDAELPVWEARLAHYVRTSCAIHGEADLTGLSCAMLDDNSGRAWGETAAIPMNHFVYGRTAWIGPDAEEPASLATRVRKLWKRIGQRWRGRPGKARDRSGWEARLSWIFRHYAAPGAAPVARPTITQANYAPQPLEQAIKVCRAEGREDYALHFEIEKQRIEWRLANRRSRYWLAVVGLAAAGLWLFFTGRDADYRWGIAAALVFGIAGISYAAGFAMDLMFGYLRRPVRAIGSLVVAFLLGWAGVHVANQRGLMVVNMEPVAGLVLTEEKRTPHGPPEKKTEVGTQMILAKIDEPAAPRGFTRDIACEKEISEPLYALDVLIPLIDLRQESRCDVGRARNAKRPTPMPLWWREKMPWVAALLDAALDSGTFWAAAKALYAIAGWFIVSLSILTFIHTNQMRSDAS